MGICQIRSDENGRWLTPSVFLFFCRARQNRTAAIPTPRVRTTTIRWPDAYMLPQTPLSAGFLFRFLRERSQALGADVGTLAFHEKVRPLQISPFLGPTGRIIVAAQKLARSAADRRFSAFFAHSHNDFKSRGLTFLCQQYSVRYLTPRFIYYNILPAFLIYRSG